MPDETNFNNVYVFFVVHFTHCCHQKIFQNNKANRQHQINSRAK